MKSDRIIAIFVIALSTAYTFAGNTHRPYGEFVGLSACNNNHHTNVTLSYAYNHVSELNIVVSNITMNCCAISLHTDFFFNGKKVVIRSKEKYTHGPCDCICDFATTFTLSNLVPDIYEISFDGRNSEGHELYNFTIDLINKPVFSIETNKIHRWNRSK